MGTCSREEKPLSLKQDQFLFLDICVTSLTKDGQICSVNAGMSAEENVPSGLTWATVCTGGDYSSYHPCLQPGCSWVVRLLSLPVPLAAFSSISISQSPPSGAAAPGQISPVPVCLCQLFSKEQQERSSWPRRTLL